MEPFNFPLVGNTSFEGMPDTPFVLVTFPLPCFLNFIDNSDFGIPIDRHAIIIRVRGVQQKRFDERLHIERAQGIEIERDRAGQIKYSEVQVRIHLESMFLPEIRTLTEMALAPTNLKLSHQQIVDTYSEPAIKIGIGAVNRLISLYRCLSREYYVKPVLPHDISNIRIEWYFPGCGLVSLQERQSWGGAITLARLPVSNKFHETLQQWLTFRYPVPLHVDLLLNAQDFLDRGDYRVSVIESRTAIEIYLDNTLNSELTKKRCSLEQSRDILKPHLPRSFTPETIKDILQWTRINNKLTLGLQEVIGTSLQDEVSLWKRWETAKTLRENVVHYGGVADPSSAKDALETIKEIIHLVEQRLGHTP